MHHPYTVAGEQLVKPSVGRTVIYFPPGRGVGWPAIVTFVHDRNFDPRNGAEVGPWVISLTAFPPPALTEVGESGFPSSPAELVRVGESPLAGMYGEDEIKGSWEGCWNWSPRYVVDE